jgi:3-oxoacyl-[acyl-carrier-protein] synthase II
MGITRVNRVVVTGLGAMSPLGLGASALWRGVAEGRSGIGFNSNFDTSTFPIRIAGQVRGFTDNDFGFGFRLPRSHQLCLAAVGEALENAGLSLAALREKRLGVYIGFGIAGLSELELLQQYRSSLDGYGAPPAALPAVEVLVRHKPGAISSLILGYLGVAGRSQVLDSACASGAIAIGAAFRDIRSGRIELALAGGTCSLVDLIPVASYHKLRALAVDDGDPAAASCPFDARRRGFVMSEGAGMLLLESLESAAHRNAVPLAEITGYGITTSGYRLTDMPPDGTPQRRAMHAALIDAGRSPDEIDYVNAHGTSTRQNDPAETQAIKDLCGPRAYSVPVSSTKSMIGHAFTAAGALEAVVTVMAVHSGVVPPTINYQVPCPECDLDYVPSHARTHPIKVALNNSFGFGGQNAVNVFEKFPVDDAHRAKADSERTEQTT